MTERIETMRSYFQAADHDVDAAAFARAMFRNLGVAAARELAAGGVVPRPVVELLERGLPDPDAPGAVAEDAPVAGYVNGGAWKAKCECQGAELVDMARPIFMCCNCWNVGAGHRWRRVVLPQLRTIAAAEAVLLARPDPNTRNWRPADGETVRFLMRENRAAGVMPRVRRAA